MRQAMLGLVLFLALSLAPLSAVDRPMALAMSVGQRGGDFSLGAEVMTPPFFGRLMTIYGGVDVQYKAGKIISGDQQWYPYVLTSIGLQVTAGQTDWMRLYASSALLVIVPSSEVGSSWHMGGYGGFGVEFFFVSGGRSSYYFEIGGAGTNAKARALVDKPYLGNGLNIKAGYRFLLF